MEIHCSNILSVYCFYFQYTVYRDCGVFVRLYQVKKVFIMRGILKYVLSYKCLVSLEGQRR